MNRVKYPRTMHLPSSPGKTNDDKVLKSTEHLIGQHVVITEKMDGENTTIYPDGKIHARSLDSMNHPSRNWLKNQFSNNDLPAGLRMCGENVYAKHSIGYENLDSYFFAFSIWEEDKCLSWDDTVEYLSLMDVSHVPVLWSGVFYDGVVQEMTDSLDIEKQEGFVIRLSSSFKMSEFSKSVAKWVRAGHVQADSEHWMRKDIQVNVLKKDA